MISRTGEHALAPTANAADRPRARRIRRHAIGPVSSAGQLDPGLRYVRIDADEGAALAAGVDYHVPFGGRKASGYGPRKQGRYAQEFFTVVKTAYTLS